MNSNGTLEGHGLLLLLSWKGEKEIQFEATATIGVEVGFLRGRGPPICGDSSSRGTNCHKCDP